jgi:DNA modification methylase
MKTKHILKNQNASSMNFIDDGSVNLVVTSPPYPMIEMWDDIFSSMNPEIGTHLRKGNASYGFELMHQELDKIWKELYRVTADGGIVCINIGDATRTIGKNFQIFMNSSRIITYMTKIGFCALPQIIWQKTTNSPNKFMGSGMYPGGAYVTLEHEHILVFRKGLKRAFKGNELILRRQSAYFWEERNIWFSDMWNMKGEKQKSINGENRERTAAYPIELPMRIINMYSKYGDTVLDPFLGTGTTTLAAMVLGRNSIGVDIDESFISSFKKRINNIQDTSNYYIENRLKSHSNFIENRDKPIKYSALSLNVPVVTSQEKDMLFYCIKEVVEKIQNEFIVDYSIFSKID